jgi:hypothetical protein
MIAASCHCGAMRLETAHAPATVTDCNCSICRRLGVLWAYYRPDQVAIRCASDATVPYVWCDRVIAFHHCKICGCLTHWEDIREPFGDRMGVNARLMDLEVLAAAKVRKFDGAVSGKFQDGE